MPEVKLIAILRDPIERCISHYKMSRRRGAERRSLEQAVSELLREDRVAYARRLRVYG
jgi:hypothetical protein